MLIVQSFTKEQEYPVGLGALWHMIVHGIFLFLLLESMRFYGILESGLSDIMGRKAR